jgi:hypothetical protein
MIWFVTCIDYAFLSTNFPNGTRRGLLSAITIFCDLLFVLFSARLLSLILTFPQLIAVISSQVTERVTKIKYNDSIAHFLEPDFVLSGLCMEEMAPNTD